MSAILIFKEETNERYFLFKVAKNDFFYLTLTLAYIPLWSVTESKVLSSINPVFFISQDFGLKRQ